MGVIQAPCVCLFLGPHLLLLPPFIYFGFPHFILHFSVFSVCGRLFPSSHSRDSQMVESCVWPGSSSALVQWHSKKALVKINSCILITWFSWIVSLFAHFCGYFLTAESALCLTPGTPVWRICDHISVCVYLASRPELTCIHTPEQTRLKGPLWRSPQVCLTVPVLSPFLLVKKQPFFLSQLSPWNTWQSLFAFG